MTNTPLTRFMFLEDDRRRVETFRAFAPRASIRDSAKVAISELHYWEKRQRQLDVLFLDRDLDTAPGFDYRNFESGEDVANAVAEHRFSVKLVVIHSHTSGGGGVRMHNTLEAAGIPVVSRRYEFLKHWMLENAGKPFDLQAALDSCPPPVAFNRRFNNTGMKRLGFPTTGLFAKLA